MFLKKLLFLIIIFGASTASATIIKVEVNGVFASNVNVTNYTAPDTAIFYSYLFDTNDMYVRSPTQVVTINPVTVNYQLGSSPMVSFDSEIVFLDFFIGVIEAPFGAGTSTQININTATRTFMGPASDLNFNLGTIPFQAGFYEKEGFAGEYTFSKISEVSEPSTVLLSLLAVTALCGLRKRVKK